jgi:GH25 family lysozyme M1 (1,4-beta-N-acetylmuramidase)
MLPGIDVSNWQGTIDWQQVSASGIKFAFIKATEGETFRDARTAANFHGATESGIVPGLYHFFRANSDSIKQADNFLAVALDLAKSSPALPPVLDLEDTGSCSNAVLRDLVHDFLQRVQQVTSTPPIIYVSPNFWKAHMAGYKTERNALWIAHWRVDEPRVPSDCPAWTFWQHSNKGTVPGIHGDVDLDWFHGNEDDLRKLMKPIRTSEK